MSQSRRILYLVLSIFTFAAAPSLPAYAAAAEIFDATQADATAAEWIPVLGDASTQIGALSDPVSQNIYGILGQIQLEAALHPYSKAAMEFTAELPAHADTPEKLLRLSAEVRAQILARAVASASADLSAQAAPLLAKLSNPRARPSNAERAVLRELADAWFYLPAGQATELRSAALRWAGQSALQKALNAANALTGKIHFGDVDDSIPSSPEIDAAVKMTFARLRPALDRARSQGGPTGVRDILAPQAAAALVQASRSLSERGQDHNDLWTAILLNHRRVFGVLADEKMVRELRQSGQWTELVSAMSLTAAGILARADSDKTEEALRKAGADYDLRLPIPAWHTLFGKFQSVADVLSSAYGPPPEQPLGKGLYLGRPFGIPVIARWGAAAGIIVIAARTFFNLSVFGGSITFLMSIAVASAVLIYASTLTHEFGHALVARAQGIKVHKITLNAMGGGAYIDHEARKPLANFLINAAGPAVNLLLAAPYLPVLLLHIHLPHLLVLALAPFIGINLVLAATNFAPLLPLDGGRMLNDVLSAVMHDDYRAARATEKMTKIAAWVLLGVSMALLFYGHEAFSLILGFFGVIGLVPHVISHPGTTLVEQKPEAKGSRARFARARAR